LNSWRGKFFTTELSAGIVEFLEREVILIHYDQKLNKWPSRIELRSYFS
jgi:hypothetical protein